jgi:hypothetical protein
MPTPVAVLSGGTRGFELGMFKKGPVAQGFNFPLNTNYTWWNGVDILSTQYLIYTDKYTMGSSTLANTIPVAWSTPDLNDSSLLALINTLPPRVGLPGFTDLDAALNWMDGTGDFFLLKNGIENIVTSDLLLYWDAGLYSSYVGTGNVVSDLSGNNKNGNLTNGASFSSAGVASFDLDGTDDYISIGTLSYSNNVTVEAWVNTTNPIGWDDIIAGGCGDLLFGVDSSDTGTVSWGGQCNSPFSPVTSTTSISDGRWHHVVGTYNGSTAAIYVDGILERSLARSGSFTPGTIAVGSAGGGGEHFSGNVAIARIYATALTAEQVLQNYNTQKGRFGVTSSVESNLVLELDASNPSSYSGSGSEWTDMSSYGNNGTLTNGVSFSTDNGGILVFDGSDDYVNLGYKSSLLNFDITQEAWVNADSFTNWHGIISNMSSWGTGFSLQIGNIQNIAAMISGDYLITSWLPSTGVWYHIVATHRSSDNLNVLYVNGIQENSVIRSISYETNAVTTIGAFYTPNGLLFDGKIGKVKSYNKALTAPEVVQNFETERGQYGVTGITRNGLILWCDAGNYASYNGSGTTWYDVSGSVFDATLLNGPTYTTNGGGGISRDSTDDFISAYLGGLTSTTNFSVEVWMNINPQVGATYNAIVSAWNYPIGAGGWELQTYNGAIGVHPTYTVAYTPNTNVHIVYTQEGTTTKIYKDSVLSQTSTTSTSLNNGNIGIGNLSGQGYGGYNMNGTFYTVRVYNKTLNQTEITQNFNAQKNRYGL